MEETATAMSIPPVLVDPYPTASEVNIRRTVVSPDESLAINHILSRELLKLSITDRSAIQEEIHGVQCLALRESPELLQKGLELFEIELEKIPLKSAYEECRVRTMLYRDEEDSCYALQDSFKLRFLRVELFDAAKAAQRFVNYLEFVRESWGADIFLTRLIRFSDFTKAEMKLFRKGYFQVLPFRDHCGRRVLTLLGGFEPGVDPTMRAKILFYMTDVLTRNNIESQQTGLVVIGEAYMWSPGDSGSRDKHSKSFLSFPHPQEGVHHIRRLFDSMANRLIAVHNCWPDRPAFRIISKLLTIYGVSGSTQRLRLKFHVGDELEMRYRLKSYGIPIELLPITDTGSIKLINHNHWIKTRKYMERNIDDNINVTIVECPGLNDVVFRQGTSSMENPGNVVCRDLVLSLLEDRDRATGNTANHCNTIISSSVAAKVHHEFVDRLVDQIENQHGGRFLEWDKQRGTWTQMIGGAKVKQKVSVLVHAIDKRYRKTQVALNSDSDSSSDIRNQKSTIQSSSIVSNNKNNNNMTKSPIGISRDVSNNSNINANINIINNKISNIESNRLSPSLVLQENLVAMVIKSDDDEEDEAEEDKLGPYSFLEGGGRSFRKQKQCCRIQNEDFASQQLSGKRLRRV